MKKGFTLIELLAVIVILAIIALIATPIVLNIINETKESAQLRSAEMYLRGVETSIATATLNNKVIKDDKYNILEDGNICIKYNEDNSVCKEKIELEMNGETPNSGYVTIQKGEIKDISLIYSNGKTIVKNTEGKLVYSGSQKLEYKAYSIGDEVTIGTEKFYVIVDSDVTQEKVTLLAKDCIVVDESSEDYLKQSASAGEVAFSSTLYWSGSVNVNEYRDLNEYQIPEHVDSIITTAKTYGANLGGTGRLMNYYNEAEPLQSANSDILYGRNGKSSSEYLNYFLSNGCESMGGRIVIVVGSQSSFGDTPYTTSLGVRPVVEISKSKIF